MRGLSWPGPGSGVSRPQPPLLTPLSSLRSVRARCAPARPGPDPLSQSGSCTSERFPDKLCTEIPEITRHTDTHFCVRLDNNLDNIEL